MDHSWENIYTGCVCMYESNEMEGTKDSYFFFPRSNMDHFFYFCFINNDCMAQLLSLADLKFLPVRGTRLNKQKKEMCS